MTTFILLFIFGYLLGSIPSGYIISRKKGVDIRTVGSGNIGGTNVSRAFGLKWGALVGILDILKGIIPAYLAGLFLTNDWQIVLVLLSPVLGHIFPVWLKFKGGKGVATTAGVLLVILSFKYIAVLLATVIMVLLALGMVSFASLVLALLIPLALWNSFYSYPYLALGLILMLLIWWAHRENIQRIKNKTEPKIFKKKLQTNNQ
jgi:glycerol-3-phosphate acyltransferase PlsY